MRALQKLVRNSNSTGITIPKSFLHHLGWLQNQSIVIEIIEGNALRVRLLTPQDLGVSGPPQMLPDPLPTQQPFSDGTFASPSNPRAEREHATTHR